MKYLISLAILIVSTCASAQSKHLFDIQKLVVQNVAKCVNFKDFRMPTQNQIIRCVRNIDIESLARQARAILSSQDTRCLGNCINGRHGLTSCLRGNRGTYDCVQTMPTCVSACFPTN